MILELDGMSLKEFYDISKSDNKLDVEAKDAEVYYWFKEVNDELKQLMIKQYPKMGSMSTQDIKGLGFGVNKENSIEWNNFFLNNVKNISNSKIDLDKGGFYLINSFKSAKIRAKMISPDRKYLIKIAELNGVDKKQMRDNLDKIKKQYGTHSFDDYIYVVTNLENEEG